MANELQAETTTGLTLYAVLISATGTFWNTAGTPGLEAYNGANWTDYDIALTEAGAGIYLGDMPAAAAGVYSYAVYSQAGASPATTDTLKGTGWLTWDGSVEIVPASKTQAEGISAQISAIGSGTGAALNFAVDADNASAPLNGVTKIGTPTGTFANTLANDASVHSILAVNSTSWKIDWVYGFTVGAGRSATKIVVRAAMAAAGDTVTFKMYNFLTSTWDVRTTITGTASQLIDIPALAGHTGTGVNAGKVYLEIVYDEGDTGTININECYCQAQNLGLTVGYADGSIWVGGTNTNTTPYVDGTADNPVTWAAALTLSTAIGLTRFRIRNGFTVTLTGATENKSLVGSNWTLALGGRSITGSYIEGATISGVSSGSGAEFVDCHFSGTQTVGGGDFFRCGFGVTTFTMLASGNYNFVNCYDDDPSTATSPVFVFATSAVVGARNWRGAFECNGLASTNAVTLDGAGRLIIASNCTGTPQAPISIRGFWTATTDNVSGGYKGVITDTSRYSEDQNVTNVTGTVATVTTLTNLPAVTTDWMSAAGMSAGAVTKIQTGLATPTNITAGTITTVTNLTNAPTAGDFTGTMKTSLNAATPASITGSVGSVAGNVTGSVGSVATGGITAASIATNAIDADALATDAVTEIQSGLALQASVDDLEGRLTATRAGYLDNLSAGAVATAASIAALNNLSAAQVWQYVIETLTAEEILQVALAVLAGKSDGGGSTTIHFRDYADLVNRITATVDANGNRTAITLNLT